MVNDLKWYHGTCDLCNAKNILVLHFGYDNPKSSYRICKNCLAINIQYILYGCHYYNDSLVDLDEVRL